jgi:hypothetical protein
MKRKALITLILGTALAVAPAARAVVMSDGSISSSSPVSASSTLQPNLVGDGWMSSILPSVTLRPDILGGDGGVSTPAVPTATGGDSFAWNAAIGGAALIGAMLLGLAFALANRRRRHQLSF